MARPRIEIDWEEFDKLCGLQCTQEEIASWFDCSADTIDRRVREKHGVGFAEIYPIKRGKGQISLRRKQMAVAMAGNPTMLIFLGKQYLGQADKREDKVSLAAKKLIIDMGDDDND